MAAPFATEDIYRKIFRIGPEEKAALRRMGRGLWRQCAFVGENSDRPVNIACIGYGSGLRDFPLLLALRDELETVASTRGVSPREIRVLAIEPGWSKQIECADGELSLQSESYSVDHQAPVRILKGRGILVELVSCPVEDWQRHATDRHDAPSFHAILALCVLHLLDDWKNTLAFSCDRLIEGGIVMLGETPGTVSYFDGDFIRRPDPADCWERVWRTVYAERDRLLLPSTKIVSPKDMSFVKNVFCEAGYTSLGEEEHHSRTPITGADLEEFIRTIEGGPDARTMGAFRFFDRSRARRIVKGSLEKLRSCLAEGDFVYDAGYRFVGFTKPASPRDLLMVTAHRAARTATSEAIERKTTIKCSLQRQSSKSGKAHTEAIAALLYDMREALALSRDTFIVAASKQDGEYVSAVQLAPLSMVGSSKERRMLAQRFVSHHAVYLSASPEHHLSHLFDTAANDVAVEIVIETDDVPRPRIVLEPGYGADGKVCFLQLRMRKDAILSYQELARKELGEFLAANAADIVAENAFDGWTRKDGFSRFYFESKPALIRESLQSPQARGASFLARLQDCTQLLLQELTNDITQEIHTLGVTDTDPQEIAKALANAIRLSLVEWPDNRRALSWRSCHYIMRRMAGNAGRHTGVSILMLLGESDHLAWTRAGKSRSLPVLISSVEPFLNAIQAIESWNLARDRGAAEGAWRTLSDLSHEAKHVALAVRGWPSPMTDLFSEEPEKPDSARIGSIKWDPAWRHLRDDFAIVPLRHLFDTATAYLVTWTLTDSPASLPFFCAENPQATASSFEDLLRKCWKTILDVETMHVARTFMLSTPASLAQFSAKRKLVEASLPASRIQFQISGTCSLTWASADDEEAVRRTVWLSRLLMHLCREQIQWEPWNLVKITLKVDLDQNVVLEWVSEKRRADIPAEQMQAIDELVTQVRKTRDQLKTISDLGLERSRGRDVKKFVVHKIDSDGRLQSSDKPFRFQAAFRWRNLGREQ